MRSVRILAFSRCTKVDCSNNIISWLSLTIDVYKDFHQLCGGPSLTSGLLTFFVNLFSISFSIPFLISFSFRFHFQNLCSIFDLFIFLF